MAAGRPAGGRGALAEGASFPPDGPDQAREGGTRTERSQARAVRGGGPQGHVCKGGGEGWRAGTGGLCGEEVGCGGRWLGGEGEANCNCRFVYFSFHFMCFEGVLFVANYLGFLCLLVGVTLVEHNTLWRHLAPIIFFVETSTLSVISVATPAVLWCLQGISFPIYLLFYLLTYLYHFI